MTSCKTCVSKCCRYLALEVDAPKSKSDFDNIRWFLAHRGISVFVDKKKWYMEVKNKCKYLAKNNMCNIYDKRPDICKKHSNHECENISENFLHDFTFNNMEEFDKFLRNKRKK